METEFLMLNEHPPHTVISKRNGHHLSWIFLFVTLLAITFALHFRLPHLQVVTPYFPAGYQGIQQAIEEYSGLKFLYPLVNPQLQKKQAMIGEILAILEKYETGLAKVTKEELAEVIYEEATRNNQDPKFILALIAIESSFRNWSVSERGAKGLMQIMPYVAESIAQEMGIEWSGDRTLFDPFLNIKMGVYYLSRLLLDFRDPGLALTAYNYGPTYVKGLIEKKRKVPQHFYEKIASTYHDFVLAKNRGNPLPAADEHPDELPI